MVAAFSAPLVLAACGGDDGDAASGGSGQHDDHQSVPPSAPHVATVDNAFDPQTLELPTGDPVSVHVENRGSSRHTFTVPALNVSVTLEPGAQEIVRLDVPNRETEFLCNFHGSGGMTGTIVPQ